MRRLLTLILVAASSAGCLSNVRTCSQDSQCAPNGMCLEGVCYERPSDGLDAGDGGIDSGVDAGPVVLCAEGCAAWQTCKPLTLATGVCVNATIRAVSPQENTRFTGGNPATFVFEVTQWDGGMWPGEVPFATSPGMTAPATLSRRATSFEAQVTLANTAGTQSVVAGWGAVDAGVTVVTEKCNVACSGFEECVADASGGACVDMGLTLAFTAPTLNQEFGPINSGAVPLTLTVSRADGGPFAAPIPFALSTGGGLRADGQLSKSGNVWTGSVDAGADDGTRTLFAGWDGGPSTTSTFKVTATPPTLTLVSETAPVRPPNQTDSDGIRRWKKSEVATVRLVSNRDLLAAPLPVDFNNPAAVSGPATCAEACDAPRCYCFAVNLAQLPLAQSDSGALYGAAPVSLSRPLTDVLGNSGTADAGLVPVTRLKWTREVSSGGASVPTAIALSPEGVILVGVSTALEPPLGPSVLTAISSDGGQNWQISSDDAITAGPIVATKGVYYATRNSGASTSAVRLNPFIGLPSSCASLGTNPTYIGDMALAAPGANESPLVVADDGTLTSRCNASGSSALAGGLGSSKTPTVVVEGDAAYVAAKPARSTIWKFDGLDGFPAAQGTKTVGSLLSTTNLFLASPDSVGGGGFTGGVFVFSDSGGSLDAGATTNDAPGSFTGGAAVVGPGTSASEAVVFYGDSGGYVRSVVVSTAGPSFGARGTPVYQSGSVDFSVAAPVVGQGGHLYVVGGDSSVRVLTSSPLTEEWRWIAPGPIRAQLNLDKNRDAASPCGAGQPGVLYALVSADSKTSVYAILVDSQGVDAAAPWPRYQHNPANTGNRATGLDSWICQ